MDKSGSAKTDNAAAAKAFANPDEFICKDIPLAADVQSLADSREIYKEVASKYPRRFPMPIFVFERAEHSKSGSKPTSSTFVSLTVVLPLVFIVFIRLIGYIINLSEGRILEI